MTVARVDAPFTKRIHVQDWAMPILVTEGGRKGEGERIATSDNVGLQGKGENTPPSNASHISTATRHANVPNKPEKLNRKSALVMRKRRKISAMRTASD